jgi:hypothetical protein
MRKRPISFRRLSSGRIGTSINLRGEPSEARPSQDWRADVAAYERAHEQILRMAGMLSGAIIKQFPAKL